MRASLPAFLRSAQQMRRPGRVITVRPASPSLQLTLNPFADRLIMMKTNLHAEQERTIIMKTNHYPITFLPRKQWEGTIIPMRYTTDEYFDVKIEEEAEDYCIRLHKRRFDAPVTHFPEEYDFPDKLYQPHWEKACAWGITEPSEEEAPRLLACIETCPEEWSNRLLVTELWVDESLRRQGIGHALMELARKQAMRECRRAIILETQSCNTGAIQFYRQEGFELIGIDSCCYSNRDIARKEVRVNMGYFLEPHADPFTFERATHADQEEILTLYRSLAGTEYCAWTQDYPGEPDIREDLSRNDLFCLRDTNKRIAGVISIDDDDEVEALPCWTKELQPSKELSRLGVHPEYQNQGIAGMLLQHAMDELRSRGIKSVHFLVCKTNQKAIRAYDKIGFDVVGECRMHDLPWWCYERQL